MGRTVYSSSAGLLNGASWFSPHSLLSLTPSRFSQRSQAKVGPQSRLTPKIPFSKLGGLFSTIGNPAGSALRESELAKEPRSQMNRKIGGEQPSERAKVTKSARNQFLLKENLQKRLRVIDFFHK